MFDDFDHTPSHFIPSFQASAIENVIPVAGFIAKKLRTLNNSFRTSTDYEERQEIMEQMILYSASLSVLHLAYYAESQTLIDASKELFRGI